MQGHRDLVAWQKGMKLVKDIYRVTLRRAAVSVPSNLAEGHGRNSRREFHQFVGHARGSLLEIETQLEIARDLGYLPLPIAADLLAEASEVGPVLNGLRAWCASAKTDS